MATRGSAPASASAPNVLMAKIQLAKKTVAHAHAKCQLWTAQAGGRADGETERRTDEQTISQRPAAIDRPRDPEVKAGGGVAAAAAAN